MLIESIPEIDLEGRADEVALFFADIRKATKERCDTDDAELAILASEATDDVERLVGTGPRMIMHECDGEAFEVPFGLDTSAEDRVALSRKGQREPGAPNASKLARLFDELEAKYPDFDFVRLSEDARSRFGLRTRIISQLDISRSERRKVRPAELNALASGEHLYLDGERKRVLRTAFDGFTLFVLTA